MSNFPGLVRVSRSHKGQPVHVRFRLPKEGKGKFFFGCIMSFWDNLVSEVPGGSLLLCVG